MCLLLRKQGEIQQIDRDRSVQLLIILAAMKRLVHLRPIIERALFHIAQIHELNFDVDARAVIRNTTEVEP